jgi:hypothetical protein
LNGRCSTTCKSRSNRKTLGHAADSFENKGKHDVVPQLLVMCHSGSWATHGLLLQLAPAAGPAAAPQTPAAHQQASHRHPRCCLQQPLLLLLGMWGMMMMLMTQRLWLRVLLQ